ncbi:MAG: (d)CMP kinase [Deltaproteobacteria bacterium]|nr:(d)CMP kinase [Deltaproteobacteria bacterium]
MGRQSIITIDGPAGAGKSTAAKRLARAMGFHYLDSGALYRAVAWETLRRRVDVQDSAALSAFFADFKPHIAFDEAGFRVLIDGREVAQELRTPEVSQASSRVAAVPQVRRWVTACLRNLARNRGVVAEGRDMGTVVFPEAEVKFFLTADLATRAARRRDEWQSGQIGIDLEGTMRELATRDRQDETRTVSPLKAPVGAIHIDTTSMTPEEVTSACLAVIRDALARTG